MPHKLFFNACIQVKYQNPTGWGCEASEIIQNMSLEAVRGTGGVSAQADSTGAAIHG